MSRTRGFFYSAVLQNTSRDLKNEVAQNLLGCARARGVGGGGVRKRSEIKNSIKNYST